MRIEIVSMEDVYPVEDEFGNCYLSRDYTLKENQDYVSELAASFGGNRQPNEPPVLVRDGGIYRIKAGNSRIRAMQLLGVAKFTAIIDEEDDVQSLIEAAIRTNKKKKYEAVEESRFVQQLAMFADDDYVSQVAGIDRERVKRIRRGKDAVDDRAEDMTLWRLEAIGEFADMPEAVKELSECREREYAGIAAKWRGIREKQARANAVVSVLESRGVEIADNVTGMEFVGCVSKASEIPAELPQGAVAAPHDIPGFYGLYAPAEEKEVDDEAEKLAATRDAIAKVAAEGIERRRNWLAVQIGANAMPNLSKLVEGNASRTFAPSVMHFIGAVGDSLVQPLPAGPAEIIAAFELLNASTWGIFGYECQPETRLCKAYATLLNAMEKDGYEPDETEQDIYQQAIDFLGV